MPVPSRLSRASSSTASSRPRHPTSAWLTSPRTLYHLAQLVSYYLSYYLSYHLATHNPLPPRFLPDKIRPTPEWDVPPALCPLNAALYAWARGWAWYVEMHWRTPEEIAEDNWHWRARFDVWPEKPLTGCMARQLPYRVIPTQPGVVRVSWYYEIKEMLSLEARKHPEMYEHLQLEPDGSLKIGDLRRKWGMENMVFVEWNRRFLLWPCADGETLGAVTVRHLLDTGERWPFLRVIEIPGKERRELRKQRARLLEPWHAPRHIRLYLRARHALFRTMKTWYAFRRPFIRYFYEDTGKRVAVTVAIILGLAAAAALVGTVWVVRVYLIPQYMRESERMYAGSTAERVVHAVLTWAKNEPRVMEAAAHGWAALCALPMLVFWTLTVPVWGPFWLVKVTVLGVWWAATALFWMALAGLTQGALDVKAPVSRAWAAWLGILNSDAK
ncbi:hypothetical protein DAEQUDRAFT_755201 [Daedalea quercina L-15889]|uniref:Uncharacterized protein n=1 Tax=Daedalea quercina L-15889 TaxID=1314783 RepID=A0A165SR49_9APHY|nr:hypothetical protein DAEQUDRAFT_755201 [Daedalea quercina L-15889]